jgi:hypothetical protein
MKYFLRILLAIFCLVLLFGVWFFFLRSGEREYVDLGTIDTKIHSGRTSDYKENRNAYFGDLHIHSSWSFDAFILNVRTSPDDAYRFGKGEAIAHSSGAPIQIKRPLDFMAVTDHAEYMGIMMQMQDQNSPLSKLEIAKGVNSSDDEVSLKTFRKIGMSMATKQPFEELLNEDIMKSTWQRIVETADRHNEPGRFTTFPAYEWTSSPLKLLAKERYSEKLHRNVIYKGGKVSGIPFSAFHSQDPEDLWKWMDTERNKGIEILAIPHNANMSSGQMYNIETLSGKPLTASYAESRSRNEPVNEVVQIKGQSMIHPALAPNDEFADFELYEFSSSLSVDVPLSQPKHSYVRGALKDGLTLERSLGTNPYQFGFIGSSDSHNSASAAEEDNYFGKVGSADATPEMRLNPPEERVTKYMSAAGLAGVWAKENTREAIFEALERKETFATSGPRIQLRFFAGWNLEVDSLVGDAWIEEAYTNGVPMGGELKGITHDGSKFSPSFLIQAIKDVEGANLDRIQVIKGFLDEEGVALETIYDVVWAGERSIDNNGKLPAIGNTVDITSATYSNRIGNVNLQTIWTDPDFNPSQSAFYYLRVLEIPTPRWSTYDAASLGIDPLSELPTTIQERAWSSPIWYNPQ